MQYSIDYNMRYDEAMATYPVIDSNQLWGPVIAEFVYEQDAKDFVQYKNALLHRLPKPEPYDRDS